MKLTRYHNSPLADFDSFFRFPNTGISPFFDFANRLANLANEAYSSETGSFFEDDDNYYGRFDLPGVKKSDLNVELNGTQLELSVSQAVHNESEEEAVQREISWERAVTVPEGIDPEKVSAKLEDGVLTVTLPKAEARKPRSIRID